MSVFRAAPAALLCLLLGTPACASDGWDYYVAGDAQDVVTQTTGLLVLQGGGDWIDKNYSAMAKAGGHGDFVVLRASGTDEYSDYIYAICECDSVESIVFNDRAAAFDEKVLATIRNAEALFIAGGDQARYVRFWKDTPVATAINELAQRSVPIGGTSAGMAVLGEFVYSALADESLTSEAALADPFDANLTLTRDFLELPRLANTLTDQHLEERDRMGRTVTMLSRLLEQGWTDNARAIAADRETALHVDPATGIGRVFATADHDTPYVYFLRLESQSQKPQPGQALSTDDVSVYRAGPGDTFDLGAWQGTGGDVYTLRSVNGVLKSSSDSVYGRTDTQPRSATQDKQHAPHNSSGASRGTTKL